MIITNGKATKFCARKWNNKSEKMNNEEQLREKDRKEEACTTSNQFCFLQNEVTN